MPEFNGIVSPPYPNEQTTAERLYDQLGELRAWVIERQNELEAVLKPKYASRLVPPGPLDSLAYWNATSVIDKYTVLIYMRRIRESWDNIIREHEDAWNSRLSLKKQFNIVLLAQHVLADAFVNPELREARNQQAQDEAAKRMKLIDDHLRRVLTPPELQEDTQEEPEDADNVGDAGDDWFKPDME